MLDPMPRKDVQLPPMIGTATPSLQAAIALPEVAELIASAKEVGRISDRDHVAWRRLSAALDALKGTP